MLVVVPGVGASVGAVVGASVGPEEEGSMPGCSQVRWTILSVGWGPDLHRFHVPTLSG